MIGTESASVLKHNEYKLLVKKCILRKHFVFVFVCACSCVGLSVCMFGHYFVHVRVGIVRLFCVKPKLNLFSLFHSFDMTAA